MKVEIIQKQMYYKGKFITLKLIVTIWAKKYKRIRTVGTGYHLIKEKWVYRDKIYITRHVYRVKNHGCG